MTGKQVVARAHNILNRVKDGQDVSLALINWALRITGDLE
jgi:hypothetical protein